MSIKYKILGSIEAVQQARQELLQKAVAIVQSSNYTEKGRTAKIGELIEPYEKKLSSYALDIEKMFDDQIEKVTAEERNEQQRRNTSLEYQQLLLTKAEILKNAVAGMNPNDIYEYVKEFENDPQAIAVFSAILSEYNQNLSIKAAKPHKMPEGLKWGSIPECTLGKTAEKLDKGKNSILNLFEKMSFKNYVVGTAAIASVLHDKTLDVEIQCIMDYVRKNIT